MNRFLSILLLTLLTLAFSCKKKEEEVDPYAFLKRTWHYANGAECIFEAASKTAKGIKVPTNNTAFKFVIGEDYWRSVTTTGVDKWSYEQIVRFSDDQIVRFADGKTVEYRKSTMTKKDVNTLSIGIPGLTDDELTRVP